MQAAGTEPRPHTRSGETGLCSRLGLELPVGFTGPPSRGRVWIPVTRCDLMRSRAGDHRRQENAGPRGWALGCPSGYRQAL